MMKRCFAAFAVVLVLLGLAAPVMAQLRGREVLKAEAVWSASHARPGDPRALAIVLTLDEHWHINPATLPADSTLIPTTLTVEGPEPVRIGQPQFPKPTQVQVNYTGTPQALDVHEGRVVVYVPVVVSPNAPLGPIDLKVKLRYQACNDTVCLPPRNLELSPSLEIAADAAAPVTDELFAGFDSSVFASLAAGKVKQAVRMDFFGWHAELDPSGAAGLLALLGLALLGGALLNFTPCVLPVIPIKMLGLSRSAGNRARTLLLGGVMSLGVVAFWLGIGAAMGLIAEFKAVNYLFQKPWFTVGVGVVIAVMAIGMGGFFTIRLPNWIYNVDPNRGSLPGSFAFGIMTAVLSTPCTAPFMGAAAAWAVTQPRSTTLTTFAAIGIGMALPYFLLSAFPALIEKMPRTGPASELIKQVMGLLMLAAAAYFIGTGLSGALRDPADPPSTAYWWAVMGFIAAAGLWLAWRTVRIRPTMVARVAFVLVGVLLAVSSAFAGARLTDKGPIDWVYFTPERFERARREGKVVVMDFTAEWCLNCKVIESQVLNTHRVSGVLGSSGVVPMKVDLTGENLPGNDMLKAVGRVTIPALVVFAADGTQTLNSDAYTAGEVIDAVERAKRR